MSIAFWLRFKPQIRPTILTINILFITARMKGRFVCVWICLIFSWLHTHPFDLEFVAFCPKFSRDSYVEFQEKPISGNFFINLAPTKDILYQNSWNFALHSAIWAPDSSHKTSNKFFIHHYQCWKEGSFVCETVWFFRGWILIRLTWNFSRFVSNSMEILM